MGSVIGNLFCYFQFQDIKVISFKDRQRTYTVLSIIAFIGCIPFLFLKRDKSADDSKINCHVEADPLTAFKNSFTLLKTKKMMMISVCSFYAGLEMSFYLSIYATAISYTKSFGPDSSKVSRSLTFTIVIFKTNVYSNFLLLFTVYRLVWCD